MSQSTRPGFRVDIQGMRAVAVLAVVLWHAGLSWMPGGYVGVDVFFVISGFLMTSILLGEARREGRIRLKAFFARRARRLLPAAVTALIGTAVLTVLTLPMARWSAIGGDIVASAAYVLNWRMAADSVDYLEAETAPSPLQHYWSLAVEEQFYVVWPVLIALVLFVIRRRERAILPALVLLSAVVGSASLATSAWLTQTSAAQAYFVTHTRIWELAVGAGVALGAVWWPRLRPAVAAGLAWTGLVAILGSVALLDEATPFPGLIALVPVLGAAGVLIGGPSAGRAGPGALLGVAPMQFFGRISYSLYLWHWPLVVVAMQWAGDGHQVPVRWGLVAVTISILPAWLSFRYVEEPVRHSGRGLPSGVSLWMGLRISAVGVVTGLLLVTAAPGAIPDSEPNWRVPRAVQDALTPFGAMALGADPASSSQGRVVDDPGSYEPSGEALVQDTPTYTPEECNADLLATDASVCPSGDENGDTTIAVVGDSHAGQWVSALDQLGAANGWRVASVTKASCPPSLDVEITRSGQPGLYWQCARWQDNVLDRLEQIEPDLVLLSSAQYSVDSARLGEGMVSMVRAMRDRSIPAVLIRDNPRPPSNMAQCLTEHPGEASACAFDRAERVAVAGTGQDKVIEALPHLPVIDLTDAICPRDRCAAVIGGVPVYRDGNHLSDTYVSSLSPRMEAPLKELLKTAP